MAEGKARAAAKAKEKASKAKARPKDPSATRAAGDQEDAASESRPSPDGRVGWMDPLPPDVADVPLTDMEDALNTLRRGADFTWWDDAHAGEVARSYDLPQERQHDPEVKGRTALMKRVDDDLSSLCPEMPGILGVFLRNRLRLLIAGRPDQPVVAQDIQDLLEEACTSGGPLLADAAASLIESRGGEHVGSVSERVQLTEIRWGPNFGQGTLHWLGEQWTMIDYRDLLPSSEALDKALGQGPSGGPESRQCLLLHVAAAYLEAVLQRVPHSSEVQERASQWRVDLLHMARQAEDLLGEAPDRLTRAEGDLRTFIHDLTHYDHDKDYRTLAAFPLDALSDYTLHILRVDPRGHPSVESIEGWTARRGAQYQLWLLVHKGHMRLLLPPQRRGPTDAWSLTLGCRMGGLSRALRGRPRPSPLQVLA